MTTRWVQLLAGGAALGATTTLGYVGLVRPWHMRWGATDDEIQRAMPGDEIVPRPTYNSTRAITIQARPADIWPWLMQLGQGRGGMYSYEWIENALLRLNMHNADRIIPEFQHLQVGDVVPMAPSGMGPKVRALEPNQSLLLVFDNDGWTWAFGLYPIDAQQTRLVVRNRWDTTGNLAMQLFSVILDPGDFVMEHKMLLGIKQRAERYHMDLAAQHAS